MSKLPVVSSDEFEKFLIYVGCEFKRQKGSHKSYTRFDLCRPLVVPVAKELSIAVVKSNLMTLKISTEKYIEIMEKIS